jgi:hypothetical protein
MQLMSQPEQFRRMNDRRKIYRRKIYRKKWVPALAGGPLFSADV